MNAHSHTHAHSETTPHSPVIVGGHKLPLELELETELVLVLEHAWAFETLKMH